MEVYALLRICLDYECNNDGEKHRSFRLLLLDDTLRYACLCSNTDVLAIERKLSLNGRLLGDVLRYACQCSITDVLAIESL